MKGPNKQLNSKKLDNDIITKVLDKTINRYSKHTERKRNRHIKKTTLSTQTNGRTDRQEIKKYTGQTDTQIDKQIYRTDRQIDRQTNIQDRQTHRQTNKYTGCFRDRIKYLYSLHHAFVAAVVAAVAAVVAAIAAAVAAVAAVVDP